MAGAQSPLLSDPARDPRDFSATRPGERFVSDIAELGLPDDPRKACPSSRVDLFDGDAMAFSVGTDPSKSLVAEVWAESPRYDRRTPGPPRDGRLGRFKEIALASHASQISNVYCCSSGSLCDVVD